MPKVIPKIDLETTIKHYPTIIAFSPNLVTEDPKAKKKNIHLSSAENEKKLTIYKGSLPNIYFACDPVDNFTHPESIKQVLLALPAGYAKTYIISEENTNTSSYNYDVSNITNNNITDTDNIPENLLPLTNSGQFNVKQTLPDDENKQNCPVIQITYYTDLIKSNQTALVEHASAKEQLIQALMEACNEENLSKEKASIVFLGNSEKIFAKTIFVTLSMLLKKNKPNDLTQYENIALKNDPVDVYRMELTALPRKHSLQEQKQEQAQASKKLSQQQPPKILVTSLFGIKTYDIFKKSFDLMKYITLRKYLDVIAEKCAVAEKFIFNSETENKAIVNNQQLLPHLLELQFIKNDIENQNSSSHESLSFARKLQTIFDLAKTKNSSANNMLEINIPDMIFILNTITAIKLKAIGVMTFTGIDNSKIEQQKNANNFTTLLSSIIAIIEKLQSFNKPQPDNQIINNNSGQDKPYAPTFLANKPKKANNTNKRIREPAFLEYNKARKIVEESDIGNTLPSNNNDEINDDNKVDSVINTEYFSKKFN